jgi:hypothetical protein
MTAIAVPTRAIFQNQLGNPVPAKTAIESAMNIAKAPIPIRELGKPNTSACSESITLLQFRVSEMLHDGTNCESLSRAILSTVRRNEAVKPDMEPKNIKAPGKYFFAWLIIASITSNPVRHSIIIASE